MNTEQTNKNIFMYMYVCILVCKKSYTVKNENCFLLKMDMCIDV